MQPTEAFSTPRRALDVEDYIDILRRHKGWIAGPFLFTLVASVVGVCLWPNSYTSTATIKVTPQLISERLVQDVSNQDINSRITSIASQVLSRSELSALRNSLNLYPRENLPPEDLNDLMSKSIRLGQLPNVSGRNVAAAFSISFTYSNRYDAQKVVTALVDKFTAENMRVKDRQIMQQLEFMRSQADASKKKLDAVEAEITAFKIANPGKLPDQAGANMIGLQTTNASLSSITNAITRSQNQKIVIENELRHLKDQLAALTDESGKAVLQASRPKNPKLVTAEAKLDRQEAELASLLIDFTENFQGVKHLRAEIENTKKEVERLRAEEDAQKAEESPAVIAANPRIQELKVQISRAETALTLQDGEIASLQESEKKTNRQMSDFSSRLSAMPLGDQKWAELMREEATAKQRFQMDEANLQKAQVQAEIENRKQGETLEQLDPPSLPSGPTAPNRPLYISMGAGLGLVLGLVLAGAREMKDTSLKNLKDVRAYTQMPILGSVPLLENDFVVRRRRRIAWLGWTVACLAACLLMAGAVVYYFRT